MDPRFDVMISQLLADYEEKVGELYQIFARHFPRQGPFWSKLAMEEQRHAERLRSLQPMIDQGIPLSLGKSFTPDMIRDSLDIISRQIEEVRHNHPSLADALLIASGIEGSIIENRFYNTTADVRDEVKSILESLVKETQSHFSQIQSLVGEE